MADVSDFELDAALEGGTRRLAGEPRAAAAQYDRAADRVVVELTNGCTFLFPPRIAQGLASATPDLLAKVEVLGLGFGLHWEDLDVDFSVAGLLSGVFGTAAFMADRGETVRSSEAAA